MPNSLADGGKGWPGPTRPSREAPRQRREFKDGVFQRFSQIASAFASPKRIEIIAVLAQGERHVEAIAEQTNLTVASTSRHLQVLRSAFLVASRKEGLRVFYRLADPLVLEGYRTLQAPAEARLAEVGRLVGDYFDSTDGLEPAEQEELLRRVGRRNVIVLDMRPVEEFVAGHIAGTLSVPLAELERRLADVPRGRRIVAYCRGPYCVLAAEAVRALRRRGVDAVRLREGCPEWRDAGLPVEDGVGPSNGAKKRRA